MSELAWLGIAFLAILLLDFVVIFHYQVWVYNSTKGRRSIRVR